MKIEGVMNWLRREWAQFTVFEPDNITGGTAEFLFGGSIFYLQRTA